MVANKLEMLDYRGSCILAVGTGKALHSQQGWDILGFGANSPMLGLWVVHTAVSILQADRDLLLQCYMPGPTVRMNQMRLGSGGQLSLAGAVGLGLSFHYNQLVVKKLDSLAV